MADDPTGRVPTASQQRDSSYTSYTSYIPSEPDWWTAALVEERLRKSMALKGALAETARVNSRGAGPDAPSTGTVAVSSAPSGGDHIVNMATEALSWLRWLDLDDVGIVEARLNGAPWKAICWRYGISRPTADRRFRYALAVITWRLNGNVRSERTPSLRFLLGMRRAA